MMTGYNLRHIEKLTNYSAIYKQKCLRAAWFVFQQENYDQWQGIHVLRVF